MGDTTVFCAEKEELMEEEVASMLLNELEKYYKKESRMDKLKKLKK